MKDAPFVRLLKGQLMFGRREPRAILTNYLVTKLFILYITCLIARDCGPFLCFEFWKGAVMREGGGGRGGEAGCFLPKKGGRVRTMYTFLFLKILVLDYKMGLVRGSERVSRGRVHVLTRGPRVSLSKVTSKEFVRRCRRCMSSRFTKESA